MSNRQLLDSPDVIPIPQEFAAFMYTLYGVSTGLLIWVQVLKVQEWNMIVLTVKKDFSEIINYQSSSSLERKNDSLPSSSVPRSYSAGR